MTRKISTNFRGQSALLFMDDVRDRDTLAFGLGRLGLQIQAAAPDHFSSALVDGHHLMFIDGDNGGEPYWSEDARPDIPVIALIGSEAPSRLARLIQHGCDSHVVKPVRSSGVYSALLLAVHAHHRRRQIKQEMGTLRQRIAGRRLVMQVILEQMRTEGIDETAAYQALRLEAMNARVPMEEVARRRLAGSDPPPLKDRRRAN